MLFVLVLTQNGWSQCEATVNQAETFDVQGDMNTGIITVRFENLASDSIDFTFTPDASLPPYTGPNIAAPGQVVEYEVPYSYACPGGSMPFLGTKIEIGIVGRNGCTSNLTWFLTTDYQCGDTGISSTGDERQVGNTIERLGDGRLTALNADCLLYTSPSPRDATLSRMPSSA